MRYMIGQSSNPEAFWSHYWDFTGIVGDKGKSILENPTDIEHAVWFPEAQLNYAENLLQPFYNFSKRR